MGHDRGGVDWSRQIVLHGPCFREEGLESGVVGVDGEQENSPCVHSGLPGRDHTGTWQVRR